jgi:multiple sugar transport system permease protein
MAKVTGSQRSVRPDTRQKERLNRFGLSLNRRTARIMTYLILGLYCALILFPFVWLISASLKNEPQYYATPIKWVPDPILWSNYGEVFQRYSFSRYIFNSVWLAGYSVVVVTLVSSLVAYGFARFRFPGRNLLFILVLATMMLPQQVLLVPKLFGSAFDIFLFRQFFIGLSREIDEAARLDGCGTFGIYRRIILPQSRPVFVVVAVFTFLASWKDVWNPLIYLNSDDKRTLPLGLLYFTTPYGSAFPLLMAATVVALVVPILLYIIGQRYIDSGVAIAEVK